MIIQPSEGINKANYYGSCATAAATAAKTVTIDGFVLEPGVRVSVYFSNMNTAASPTLNVSGTGAYTIWFEYSDFYNYNALHELCEFVYVDGGTSSYWMYVGHPSSTLRNDAIGYTEYGTVARAAHSSGSYITWKDKFYKVSATIAAGDTLAVGTNLTEAKVGDLLTNLHLTKTVSTQSYSGTGSAYTFGGQTMYAITKTYTAQVGDLIIAYSSFGNNNPAMAQIVSGAVGVGMSGEYGNGNAEYTATGGVIGYCTSTSVSIRHMWKTQGSNPYGAYIIHTDISY